MLLYVAQRMTDTDVESECAAGYTERSPDRLNSRNGYRKRLWETRGAPRDQRCSGGRQRAEGHLRTALADAGKEQRQRTTR